MGKSRFAINDNSGITATVAQNYQGIDCTAEVNSGNRGTVYSRVTSKRNLLKIFYLTAADSMFTMAQDVFV